MAYSFLFSRTSPPDRWFQGYSFIGADYVFGDNGARRFEQQAGVTIGGGEDGCYAMSRRVGDACVFASDFGGYKKLWYYHTPDFWLVSNSIPRAVQALREAGVVPEPNTAQLSRMKMEGHLFAQQSSLRSIVNGLSLVPAGCEIAIGASGYSIRPLTVATGPVDYGGCLAAACQLWLARARTLLSHPGMAISVNLSGGLDLRASFAIFERARRQLGPSAVARTRVEANRTSRGRKVDRDDLEAAQGVARALNIGLNGELLKQKGIGGLNAFTNWYDVLLGGYDLVFVSRAQLDPFYVTFAGSGGESNRAYYADHLEAASFRDLVDKLGRRVRHAPDSRELRAEVLASMKMIESISPPDQDPLVLFYRHFRARFHGGHRAQTAVHVTPLASKCMARCAQVAGQERLAAAQILYDIIYSMEPALLDLPFDQNAKSPSDVVRRALTTADAGDSSDVGAIFAEPVVRQRRGRNDPGRIEIFAAAFAAARRSRFGREFLGRDFIEAAQTIMDEAADRGQLDPVLGQGSELM